MSKPTEKSSTGTPAQRYEVIAMPHIGFDEFRRAGKAFTTLPRTIRVRTIFDDGFPATKKAVEDAKKAHALAVWETKQRFADGPPVILQDALAHHERVLENALEEARQYQLEPDEVTERQLAEILGEPLLRSKQVEGES